MKIKIRRKAFPLRDNSIYWKIVTNRGIQAGSPVRFYFSRWFSRWFKDCYNNLSEKSTINICRQSFLAGFIEGYMDAECDYAQK